MTPGTGTQATGLDVVGRLQGQSRTAAKQKQLQTERTAAAHTKPHSTFFVQGAVSAGVCIQVDGALLLRLSCSGRPTR